MKLIFSKNRFLSLTALFCILFMHASNLSASKGWVANEEGGLINGTSKITPYGEQDLGDENAVKLLERIKNKVGDDEELLTPDNPVKDGKLVAQVTRQIKINDVEWHSNLMVCKAGTNKNQLFEVSVKRSNVFDLISGARHVISYCSQ